MTWIVLGVLIYFLPYIICYTMGFVLGPLRTGGWGGNYQNGVKFLRRLFCIFLAIAVVAQIYGLIDVISHAHWSWLPEGTETILTGPNR
jgi:hypothetical protein